MRHFWDLIRSSVIIRSKCTHAMKNGPIACAATKIAPINILNLLLGRGRILLQKCVRVHDKTRRAKTTLASIVFRNANLGRVQPLMDTANPFRSSHHHSINRA